MEGEGLTEAKAEINGVERRKQRRKNTDKKLHPKETNTADKLRQTNKAIKRIQMSNCRNEPAAVGPWAQQQDSVGIL